MRINGFQNTSIVSEWLFWSCIEEAWTLEILKDVIPLFMSAEWWYTPSPMEESKPNSADIWYYNVLQLRYRKLHPACYQSNHMYIIWIWCEPSLHWKSSPIWVVDKKASVFQTNQSLVKQNQDKLDKLLTLDCSNYYLELKVLYYIPCVIELSFSTIDISEVTQCSKIFSFYNLKLYHP